VFALAFAAALFTDFAREDFAFKRIVHLLCPTSVNVSITLTYCVGQF